MYISAVTWRVIEYQKQFEVIHRSSLPDKICLVPNEKRNVCALRSIKQGSRAGINIYLNCKEWPERMPLTPRGEPAQRRPRACSFMPLDILRAATLRLGNIAMIYPHVADNPTTEDVLSREWPQINTVPLILDVLFFFPFDHLSRQNNIDDRERCGDYSLIKSETKYQRCIWGVLCFCTTSPD